MDMANTKKTLLGVALAVVGVLFLYSVLRVIAGTKLLIENLSGSDVEMAYYGSFVLGALTLMVVLMLVFRWISSRYKKA